VPPDDNLLPRTGWLTDRIVSVEHGTKYSFRHDGAGPRSDRTGPYLSLHFANVYVRDQERNQKNAPTAQSPGRPVPYCTINSAKPSYFFPPTV